jgi:hypothetical protein
LIQLWWWRDVRFWVCPVHLRDARKPLSEDRRAAREAAMHELERDFLERGGFDSFVEEGVRVEDQPCSIHAIPTSLLGRSSIRIDSQRWPRGLRDRDLVRGASEAGCHVFLTTDKGILRCRDSLSKHGLPILSPAQLIEALDESGELNDCSGPWTAPAPDISALSRLYAGFGDLQG